MTALLEVIALLEYHNILQFLFKALMFSLVASMVVNYMTVKWIEKAYKKM